MTDNECTAEEDAAWAEKEAQLNGAKFEVVGEDWDGETWPPPIGAIIESFAASGYGVECEVLAVRDGHVIACALDTCVAGWINRETRPIRTERERWLDQAGSIESCMPDSYQPYELLEALYDAGLARMPRAGHETP